MIDKENLTELSFISEIIGKNVLKRSDETFILLIDDAMKEALQSDGNFKQNIAIVLSRFPNLYGHLKYTVNKEYPEYNKYVEKLLILI